MQVHKIRTDVTSVSESEFQSNGPYSSTIMSATNGPIHSNGPIIESSQSANNSRNPVIQQIILQPTELLPVLPAPNSKEDSPKETPTIISKTVEWS